VKISSFGSAGMRMHIKIPKNGDVVLQFEMANEDISYTFTLFDEDGHSLTFTYDLLREGNG
jgi:hypothetical protein